MPQSLTNKTSTLVQVMAQCRQANTFTWIKADPDLCHHMPSFSHNELTSVATANQVRPAFLSWCTGINLSLLVICLQVTLSMVLTHLSLDKMATIPDDIFKCIFMTEKFWISIQISLKFVPQGLIDNRSPLV